MYLDIDGSTAFAGSTAVSLNTWHHIALTRSGNTWTLWLDGQNTGSSTLTVLNTVTAFVDIAENPGVFYPESVNIFRVNSRPQYPTRAWVTSSWYTQNYALPSSSYYAIKDLDTNEYVIDFDPVTKAYIETVAEQKRKLGFIVEVFETFVVRKNLMTGLEFQERYDTPYFCSPSCESFWSM